MFCLVDSRRGLSFVFPLPFPFALPLFLLLPPIFSCPSLPLSFPLFLSPCPCVCMCVKESRVWVNMVRTCDPPASDSQVFRGLSGRTQVFK